MSMIGFPLLLIPLAICNIIVFLMPGLSLAAALMTLPLMSGASWAVTLSDLLLALGVVLLLFEVIKGARPGGKYFTDHLLAFLVFAGAAAEFVLLPQFGNSTFFLLSLLALVDFLSGVSLRARRPKRAAVAVEPVRASEPATAPREPQFVPVPRAPEVPATIAPIPPAPHGSETGQPVVLPPSRTEPIVAAAPMVEPAPATSDVPPDLTTGADIKTGADVKTGADLDPKTGGGHNAHPVNAPSR